MRAKTDTLPVQGDLESTGQVPKGISPTPGGEGASRVPSMVRTPSPGAGTQPNASKWSTFPEEVPLTRWLLMFFIFSTTLFTVFKTGKYMLTYKTKRRRKALGELRSHVPTGVLTA